jgi:hypothetical protein
MPDGVAQAAPRVLKTSPIPRIRQLLAGRGMFQVVFFEEE